MNLSEYELLPGDIINVDDPEHVGRIKASVPTLYDSSVMSEEAMPWIYPLAMGGYQRFSKLENGHHVWVLHNNNNYEENWYIPMFELNEGTKQIVNKYDSTEVLCARTCGGQSIYIYYNESEGLVLKVGDNKINITGSDIKIIGKNNEGIFISNGKISIGANGSNQAMVLGDHLKTLFENLIGGINQLQQFSSQSTETQVLIPAFEKLSTQLNSDLGNILSSSITVS